MIPYQGCKIYVQSIRANWHWRVVSLSGAFVAEKQDSRIIGTQEEAIAIAKHQVDLLLKPTRQQESWVRFYEAMTVDRKLDRHRGGKGE